MCQFTFYNDRITAHNKEAADTLLLVLASQAIEVSLEHHGDNYDLIPENPGSDMETAREVILLFYAENSSHTNIADTNSLINLSSINNRVVITSSAVISIFASVLLLCTIYAATFFYNNQHEVALKYGASALYILQGEYYRIISALLLHADIEHLAGNVAALIFLGIPLCSMAGTVRGVCLIILSGATGNLINAYMYRSTHLSIGASTAVMGAVGTLVSLQIIRRHIERKNSSMLKKVASGSREGSLAGLRGSAIFIIASGAAFVGMMSGGEYTDVSAHIFGFLAGLILGFPGLLLIKRSENKN